METSEQLQIQLESGLSKVSEEIKLPLNEEYVWKQYRQLCQGKEVNIEK